MSTCFWQCAHTAISIRGPVLTPSSVLTTLPSGTSTTVSASNLTVANLPAARIIQVQQPSPSGQVLSTGRITAMTLHPLVVNASTVSTANTVRGVSVTTAKPSLTITHVGKVISKKKRHTTILSRKHSSIDMKISLFLSKKIKKNKNRILRTVFN